MILGGKHHLHVGRDDAVADWLGSALRTARSGAIYISFEGQQGEDEEAARITIAGGNSSNNGNRIEVNLLRPSAFVVSEDETGLFDKLKTATEFGHKLSDAGVTISFLRKGKEAVRLGKEARPTISRLVTGSGDVQLSSAREFAKLKGDFKADNK